MLKLQFENRTTNRLNIKIFNNILGNAEKILLKNKNSLFQKYKKGIINLFIISDREIRKINKKFRQIDKKTDVISISYIESEIKFPAEEIIGEIFISFQTAKSQAEINKISLEEELKFLFVHGLLHIFGYTHETREKYNTIIGLTENILKL